MKLEAEFVRRESCDWLLTASVRTKKSRGQEGKLNQSEETCSLAIVTTARHVNMQLPARAANEVAFNNDHKRAARSRGA